jgi:hypothetical protein
MMGWEENEMKPAGPKDNHYKYVKIAGLQAEIRT